jgi:hypothetical protein
VASLNSGEVRVGPTPGRWTRDGWGPPALGGPTNEAQSIIGSDLGPGLGLDRGAVRHGKTPWARVRVRTGT